MNNCTTLFALARHQAAAQPGAIAYTFLTDGEAEERNLTYAELDAQARALAARLQTLCQPGDRVLLLYGPGLEYVAAFFGCQYAGLIPVPAYPPDPLRSERTLTRLRAIAENCRPALVIGTADNLHWVGPLIAGHLSLGLSVATDRWADWVCLPWAPPEPEPDQVALLQYTSGSTGTPRGVMVTHRNLLYQLHSMQQAADWGDAIGVSWLPMYHDLGLIAGVLTPFYCGQRVILMSPLAFAQSPARWLKAISRYRGNISGAPNFAYDLCAAKFAPAECQGLDLSCLRIMLTGGEPVRVEAIERFTATFAPYGLRPDVWRPCYGLAEATLGVTGIYRGSDRLTANFSAAALEQNIALLAREDERARRLVGCGPPIAETDVAIVEPEQGRELSSGQVGEIWVRGPGVARGYWNRPEETAAVFGARLPNAGRTPFLRTGDLGFLHQGQLFPTGRLKDLMIFGGRNVYPQDVERTVAACHPSLKDNGCAAFSIERHGQELLVVVQEVIRPARLDLDAVAATVRRAVQEEFQVPLYGLALIKTGTLLKTSSGKVQRRGSRQKFLDGQLDAVRQWEFADAVLPGAAEELPSTAARELPSPAEIRSWLLNRIARHCEVPESEIDVEAPLNQYVVDSVTVMRLAMEMQQWLGRSIAPTVLFDSPSLARLADRVADPRTYLEPSDAVDDLSEEELDRALAEVMTEHGHERLDHPR